jgi:hypothetical protein
VIAVLSLLVALTCAALAWSKRARFRADPYLFYFLLLHLAAVGLHQFEEYVWPGGFRDFFVSVFVAVPTAEQIVPSARALEVLNVFGFLPLFFVWGWLGRRRPWLGLALLFTNFGNGWFHLTYAVTRFSYNPGVVTGTLLYLPLAVLALRHAVRAGDVGTRQLLGAFALGAAVSFVPFLQVWLSHLVLGK